MSDVDVFVSITYDYDADTFEVNTNAKNPKGIVSNFLRSQMGMGRDSSPPNKLSVYKINIVLDLSQDIFTVDHNCGNKGLREGILMEYVSR